MRRPKLKVRTVNNRYKNPYCATCRYIRCRRFRDQEVTQRRGAGPRQLHDRDDAVGSLATSPATTSMASSEGEADTSQQLQQTAMLQPALGQPLPVSLPIPVTPQQAFAMAASFQAKVFQQQQQCLLPHMQHIQPPPMQQQLPPPGFPSMMKFLPQMMYYPAASFGTMMQPQFAVPGFMQGYPTFSMPPAAITTTAASAPTQPTS